MNIRSGHCLFRWMKLSIALLLLGVAGLLAMNVRHVVDRVDAVSHQRDIAALQSGLFLLGEVTSAEQVGLTIWDEAFEEVVLRRNMDWMEQAFGSDVFDADEERVLIVDGDDTVIFSSRESHAGSPNIVSGLDHLAMQVVVRVRELHERSLYRQGTGWGIHLERPGAMVPGIYAHDIATVDGLPAIVSASAFVPDFETERLTDAAPMVLVHVRYLKGSALAGLAATSQLEGIALRYVTSDEDSAQAGRHAIVNRMGNEVVTAVWTREAPGEAVFQAMVPTLVLTVLLIGLVMAGGSKYIKRAMDALARREAQAVHASRHCAFTGLANRSWFDTRLAETLAASSPAAGAAGVVLIDLDYFKSINDTLGHAAGDAVIQIVADRMASMPGDVVIAGRLGGDEFALVATGLKDEACLHGLCTQLHERLVAEFEHEGNPIPLSASVGAALIRDCTVTVSEALKSADLALYRAKRDGRGCVRLYDRVLDAGHGQVEGSETPFDERNAIGESDADRAAA